jgi:hypothetical protein
LALVQASQLVREQAWALAAQLVQASEPALVQASQLVREQVWALAAQLVRASALLKQPAQRHLPGKKPMDPIHSPSEVVQLLPQVVARQAPTPMPQVHGQTTRSRRRAAYRPLQSA